VRHKKLHTKLGRPTGHRIALIRNFAKALLLSKSGQIETTTTKAKALQPFVDSLITHGKKATLHHRRLAFSKLVDKVTVHKLFEEIAPRYAERNGGYTRVLKTRRRQGDGAEMAIIALVEKGGEAATAEVGAAPAAKA